MGYLNDVCKIGARISGTDGMKQQQDLLKKHFEALAGRFPCSPSRPGRSARAATWP